MKGCSRKEYGEEAMEGKGTGGAVLPNSQKRAVRRWRGENWGRRRHGAWMPRGRKTEYNSVQATKTLPPRGRALQPGHGGPVNKNLPLFLCLLIRN